ncbi:hypothetical protein HHI36_003366 [Cryptolaemus montrouzieri]|uniref:C-type lectin domain-containing protein n=1 Tax=Cryptolaemus montrouzieri TaxID=559131 RepID=A0ABD2PE64_9CUCU
MRTCVSYLHLMKTSVCLVNKESVSDVFGQHFEVPPRGFFQMGYHAKSSTTTSAYADAKTSTLLPNSSIPKNYFVVPPEEQQSSSVSVIEVSSTAVPKYTKFFISSPIAARDGILKTSLINSSMVSNKKPTPDSLRLKKLLTSLEKFTKKSSVLVSSIPKHTKPAKKNVNKKKRRISHSSLSSNSDSHYTTLQYTTPKDKSSKNKISPYTNSKYITSKNLVKHTSPRIADAEVNLDVNRISSLPLVTIGKKLYHLHSTRKANFHQAFQFCRRHGMNLLSINTESEEDVITNFLTKSKIAEVWTSGTDLAEEGKFVWLSTGQPFNFTDWAANEPDNSGSIEDCVQIVLGASHSKQYVWVDTICDELSYFICEVPECTTFCMRTK